MKFAKLLILITVTLFSPLTFADDAVTLTKLLDGIKTMQADFVQTILDNNGKPVQSSFGTLALKRPGKFNWDVKRPIPQLIIVNNNKLWIYDKDLSQVTIRPFVSTGADTPAVLMSHTSVDLAKNYTIKLLPPKPEKTNESNKKQEAKAKPEPLIIWYRLTPKNQDSMFEYIEFGFYKDQVYKMRMQDHIGHTTEISFRFPKFNQPIPDKLFIFKPAANVDVIDETKKSS